MERIENNPQDFLSVVTDIRISRWGSKVEVECLDDPITKQVYVLAFKNCTEVRLFAHDLDNVSDAFDNLSGIVVGKEKHQEPAIITGFIFELWVLYESFEIRKLEER
jgi:hypothetical protein